MNIQGQQSAPDRPAGFGEQAARLWAHLRRLNDLNHRISSTDDLPSVLQEIVDLACELTGARYGAVAAFGEDGEVEHFVSHGIPERDRGRLPHAPENVGVLGHLQELAEPLRLDDVSVHPRAAGVPDGHPSMHSFLGVPIRHGEDALGNLYLAEKDDGGFTDEDEMLLVLFVAQAAITIHNARLHHEVRTRLEEAEFRGREMALLHSIARIAVSTTDLQDVLRRSLTAIREFTGADAAEVWIRQPGSDVLDLTAFEGEAAGMLERRRLRLGEGLPGYAAVALEPVRADDVTSDPRFLRNGAVASGIRAFHAYPLVFQREALGVLSVAARDPQLLGAADASLLARTADELAMVIHSNRLLGEIESLAEERGRLLRTATAERARLQVLVETSPVGVLIADGNGRVEFVNHEGRRILGLDEEMPADLEWYETAIRYQRPDGPTVEPADLPLQRALRLGEVTRAEELTLAFEDGREVPVLVDAAPIVIAGASAGAVAIIQDISPLLVQREAQAALERYAVRDAIARDLHDDIIQSIYAVGLGLRAAGAQDEVTKEQALERAIAGLNGAIADLRAYIHQLSRAPESISAETMLHGRLESLVASPSSATQWEVEVDLGEDPLPPSMERQIYLVGRELISNVERHAQADRAWLSLRREQDRVLIEVRDDGIGFDRTAVREEAIGIRSIEQRFADLRGSLLIESAPGQGTRVVGELLVDEFITG